MTHNNEAKTINNTANVTGQGNNTIVGSHGAKIQAFTNITDAKSEELAKQLLQLLSTGGKVHAAELAQPENAILKKALDKVETETKKSQRDWKTVLEAIATVGTVGHLLSLSTELGKWVVDLGGWAIAAMP